MKNVRYLLEEEPIDRENCPCRWCAEYRKRNDVDPENTQADVEAEARHDRYDHIPPGTLANRLGFDPDDIDGPDRNER